MEKKFFVSLIILLFFNPAFAASPAAEYLIEFGVSFYRVGRYEEALHEFNKALAIDPENAAVRKYINEIFKQEIQPVSSEKPALKVIAQNKAPSRENIINKALDKFVEKKLPPAKSKLSITGDSQLSLGVDSEDVIWKRANSNLNEEDSRILSDAAFNRRTNTFDPRIYDRLNLNLDTQEETGLNFHGNLTVDPWSFTGKSQKFTVNSAFADTADVQLKYWSNTGYAINEIVYTNLLGNTFALPEIKVNDGKTDAVVVNGAFWPADIFNIPSQKIEREFQPIREFWADYKQEGIKIRVFPIAYQDQALTSDDPLVLSNNHSYWEQSPWINKWVPGKINSGAVPVDFTKGRFDDSLSYFTRDSDGAFLTALRGLSLEFDALENLYLTSTFAAPKDLWQDYGNIDNIINATRLKYRLWDNLFLGSLFSYRMGLNENQTHDSVNYLGALDLGFEPTDGIKVSLETASSKALNDLANPTYKTKYRGLAYSFSLIGTYPQKKLMDLKYGYDEVKPEKSDPFFAKYRFYFARMDSGFRPALSNYRETRDDSFWSRHIHFREPFEYYYGGLHEPSLAWESIESYRIGNGIDIGRDAFGFRLETSMPDKGMDNLFDIRNVHKTNGKFVENVTRDEFTYKVTDKLTSKLLGIYQKMPKTKAGQDPFIFDNDTDLPLINTAIEDGKDPSLNTGSLGLEYAFTDWLALSGVWECTNDSTLAYGNFPRGNLNTSSLTTYTENGYIFRRDNPSLYSQGLFPLPPYKFYNIWKSGLRIEPMENLEIYLDYARNEFKSAGYVDDNINHIGLEVTYTPTKRFGLYFKYTYSRWNDINRMIAGYNKVYLGHHNFFTEFRYMPHPDDELVLQYGESGRAPIGTISYDPFGGSFATLDTAHIIRMYYRRKF